MSFEEKEIDTNLYSRQIGTIGIDTMKKLVQLKILIIGMRGLGIEIAKNIILSGPNRVSLFDPEIAKINDLGSNFFLTEEDVKIGKRRDEASLKKLTELNPNVNCDIMEGEDILINIDKYNVVVITEMMNKKKLFLIDEKCRKDKKGFIYAGSLGITGFCFVDFGEHIISDKNGEDCKTFIIKRIAKNGEIFIEKSNNSTVSKGSFLSFREVGGIDELNDGKPRLVTKTSPLSFFIKDDLKFENYSSGGVCEEVKEKIINNFYSLKERFYTPYIDNKPKPFDFSKLGVNELIHCGIIALHEYYEKNNNSLPQLNNENTANEILLIAKEFYDKAKMNKEKWITNIKTFNDKIILNIAKWSRSEINPICAFLGGVVAHEIIKYTGKYTPLNQWFWFEFSEAIENLPENTDRTLINSRYDDQIAIFGNEIQKKLSESNIFMIGAGALGCEFMKNFAMMGIATQKNNKIVITDNDNIEISNLSRQFLFRRTDVGKSKSKIACRESRKMNPNFNCEDRQSRIGLENEHIFDENFWKGQTCIMNAVDNIEARKYIDNQCTFYEKPLIDSGTLGAKSNIQIIIPHVTSCYNDNKKSDETTNKKIPMCTLHNFPALIEHCIEWGREVFNTYFNDNIIKLKNWAENKESFYEKLKKEDLFTQLEILFNIKNLLLIIKNNNFEKCLESAVHKFTENFVHKIKQLIVDYPEDQLNKDGSKFWSGSKRFPHTISCDINNNLVFSFIKNYSVILARILGIKVINDDNFIKEKVQNTKIPEFNQRTKKDKESNNTNTNLNDLNDINTDNIEKLVENLLQDSDSEEIKTIKEEINLLQKDLNIEPNAIKIEKFEKDDDSNGHIDFIFACSNLRAENYNIKTIDREKLKIIAGKIIPAMSTTTAAITGLASLQLYTLLQTDKINFFRNCYLNLAVNIFIMTVPSKEIKHQDEEFNEEISGPLKAIPLNWTVWDKIIINGSKTPKELIDFIKSEYNVDVILITSNGITIAQDFLLEENMEEKKLEEKNLKIEEIYKKEIDKNNSNITMNKSFLVLEINGYYNKIPVNMPRFRYNYTFTEGK